MRPQASRVPHGERSRRACLTPGPAGPTPPPPLAGAGIGHAGARELVEACRAAGLKTAVASSADRVKVPRRALLCSALWSVVAHPPWRCPCGCCVPAVAASAPALLATHSPALLPRPHPPTACRQVDANLAAADIPLSLFDAVVSADAFEHLKPSPGEGLPAAASLEGADGRACIARCWTRARLMPALLPCHAAAPHACTNIAPRTYPHLAATRHLPCGGGAAGRAARQLRGD